MTDVAVKTVAAFAGKWQIVVDGRDVTFFRGAPIALPGYTTVDPFGYEAASLSFPQIGIDELADLDFIDGGTGDLKWLRFGAVVLIRHVNGSDKTVVFHGRVARVEVSDTNVNLECVGGLVAALSWVSNPVPVVKTNNQDATEHIMRVAAYPGNRINVTGPATGHIYVQRGSRDMTALGFVTEVLAETQTQAGDAWTILPAPARGQGEYRIQLRDYTTVDAVVTRGAPGVSVTLADDIVDHPTRFFGSGVRPDGGRWENLVTPNLGPKMTPTYPGVLQEGDTGGDVVALTRELWGNGMLDGGPTDTYTDRVGDAVEVVREDAGLAEGRTVNEAVWSVVFSSGTYEQSYRQAGYAALVQHPAVSVLNRLPDGTVMGLNPNFDPDVPRVDMYVNYGADIEKARARRNARREYRRARQSGLAGSITLTTDPLNDNGNAFHRTLLRAGQNIRLANRNGNGGPLLHIARVDVSFDDNGAATVGLTVDERARDYLSVSAAIERNALAKVNPARQWRHSLMRRSAGVADEMTGWDCESGAGIWHDVPLTGNRWSVFPVIASQAGNISRVRVELRNQATAFAMAIFARDVTREQLNRWAPDPLADRGDDGNWVSDNDAELNEHDRPANVDNVWHGQQGESGYLAPPENWDGLDGDEYNTENHTVEEALTYAADHAGNDHIIEQLYGHEWSLGDDARTTLLTGLINDYHPWGYGAEVDAPEETAPIGITRVQAARGLLVYAAGTPNTLSYETLPCGYHPYESPLHHDPTGNWQDDGTWPYFTRPYLDGARLYVAIYPLADTVCDGRLFLITGDG